MRAIDVLVENAASYPHEAVRAVAADATRTIVARHLREVTGPELDHSLDALRRLVPADRLLERDTARYFRNRTQVLPRTRTKPAITRPVVPQPHIAMELKRLDSINLPVGFRWQCAVSCGGHFYAAGIAGLRQVRVVRGSWDGVLAWRSKTVQGPVTENAPIDLLLACDPRGHGPVVLHACRQPPVPMISFITSKVVPSQIQVGSPGWLPAEAVAVAFSANGTKHFLATTDDDFSLSTLDATGTPVKSQLIAYPSLLRSYEGTSGPPVLPVPICARDEGVYLGLGNRLVLVTGDKQMRIFQIPGIVHSLCGSTPYSVGRVVATLDQGAAMFWEEGRDIVRFAEELQPSRRRVYGQRMDRAGCERGVARLQDGRPQDPTGGAPGPECPPYRRVAYRAPRRFCRPPRGRRRRTVSDATAVAAVGWDKIAQRSAGPPSPLDSLSIMVGRRLLRKLVPPYSLLLLALQQIADLDEQFLILGQRGGGVGGAAFFVRMIQPRNFTMKRKRANAVSRKVSTSPRK